MGCSAELRESIATAKRVCGWVVAIGLAGCEAERPRSYSEYLDDPIAREATLLRCNAEREVSRGDAECINAKRAAAALAAQDDGDKRKRFEDQSDRKREALRARIAARQAAEQRVRQDAQRRADAAYEQNWSSPDVATPQVSDGVDNAGGVTDPRVYTGQQFPAQPLQPGMSTSTPQSNEAVPYPGNQAPTGFSEPAMPDPYSASPVQSLEAMPEESIADEMVPASAAPDNVSTPPGKVQQPDKTDTADGEWQPFEPPPADQPPGG